MKYADASVSQYLKRMIKQIKMNRFTAIQHPIQVNLNRPQLLVKMVWRGGCEMLLTTKVVITSNAEKSKFLKKRDGNGKKKLLVLVTKGI